MKNNITQSTWLALTRMVLGMLLIWKGLLFIQDTSELQMAIQQAAAAEYGGFGHVTAAVVSILTLVSGKMISTIIILLLLVFYARRGSGPISFDRSIRKYNSAVIEK